MLRRTQRLKESERILENILPSPSVIRLAVENKVSGLKLYGKVCLPNKPPNPKILSHPNFHSNWITGLRFMAKKKYFLILKNLGHNI